MFGGFFHSRASPWKGSLQLLVLLLMLMIAVLSDSCANAPAVCCVVHSEDVRQQPAGPLGDLHVAQLPHPVREQRPVCVDHHRLQPQQGTCTHTRTRWCVHTHARTNAYVSAHADTGVYTHRHTRTQTCVHTHTRARAHARARKPMCTNKHRCIHVFVLTHRHTCTQTCTYIQTKSEHTKRHILMQTYADTENTYIHTQICTVAHSIEIHGQLSESAELILSCFSYLLHLAPAFILNPLTLPHSDQISRVLYCITLHINNSSLTVICLSGLCFYMATSIHI